MAEDQVKIQKVTPETDSAVCCSDGNFYPGGTSLRFEDGMVDEMDADGLAVGYVVEIRAFAFVDRKAIDSNMGGASKSLGLQLTSIKLRREEGDVAAQLYGPDKT